MAEKNFDLRIFIAQIYGCMSEYFGRVIGDIPPACHKDKGYFEQRYCFVDCRGTLEIAESAFLGIGIKIITASHDTHNWPEFGPMIDKPVRILDGAWVASFTVLHNCTIGAHAIVSIGAVVNGLIVPEYGFVVGNPGQVVGFYYKGKVIPKHIWEGPT